MMQDLILWTYLTPLVGATSEIHIHTGRAHHSVIFAVTMPASFSQKNWPAFDGKCTPKLLIEEEFHQKCLTKLVFLKLDLITTFQMKT